MNGEKSQLKTSLKKEYYGNIPATFMSKVYSTKRKENSCLLWEDADIHGHLINLLLRLIWQLWKLQTQLSFRNRLSLMNLSMMWKIIVFILLGELMEVDSIDGFISWKREKFKEYKVTMRLDVHASWPNLE